MGVKTALAGITFTAGGKNQGQIAGTNLTDMMAEVNLGIIELQTKLNYLVANVLTPAGTEGANITTINTQLTALA